MHLAMEIPTVCLTIRIKQRWRACWIKVKLDWKVTLKKPYIEIRWDNFLTCAGHKKESATRKLFHSWCFLMGSKQKCISDCLKLISHRTIGTKKNSQKWTTPCLRWRSWAAGFCCLSAKAKTYIKPEKFQMAAKVPWGYALQSVQAAGKSYRFQCFLRISHVEFLCSMSPTCLDLWNFKTYGVFQSSLSISPCTVTSH